MSTVIKHFIVVTGELTVNEPMVGKIPYVGEVYSGEAWGKGKINYPNGVTYLGTFKSDKWHGFGRCSSIEFFWFQI